MKVSRKYFQQRLITVKKVFRRSLKSAHKKTTLISQLIKHKHNFLNASIVMFVIRKA